MVEDVVRKNVVFAVGITGFQLYARHALEKETAVNQEVVAVDQLNALTRIVVAERAMPNVHLIAGGRGQSRQGTHDFNVGNPHRIFFRNVFQLNAGPIVGKLVAEQRNGIVALTFQQQASPIDAQRGRLSEKHLHTTLHAQGAALDHGQRLVHPIDRIAAQFGQDPQRVKLSINRNIMLRLNCRKWCQQQ